MRVQGFIERYERAYMAGQRAPIAQLLSLSLYFLFGLLIITGGDLFGWILALGVAWYFLIGSFLSGLLPFSPELRGYWEKQREENNKQYLEKPDALIFSGLGLLLASQFRRPSIDAWNTVHQVGLAFLLIGGGKFLVALISRKGGRPANV